MSNSKKSSPLQLNNQRYFNKWEIALTLQLLYGALTHHTQLFSSYGTYWSIFVAKLVREGARLTVFFFILTPLILQLFDIDQLFISLLVISITQVYTCYHLFPQYKIPAPTGQYAVGHREFRLPDDKKTQVSVFYPARLQTEYDSSSSSILAKITSNFLPLHNDSVWEPDKSVARTWALNTLQSESPVGVLIFRFLLSFTAHLLMGVINAAELGILKRRLKVIIFSHGFSAHRNSYTCFVKEWASHGYVVLCPEHYEPTLLQGYAQIPKKEGARRLKLIKQQRGEHLQQRVVQVQALLHFIADAKNVQQEIFKNEFALLDTTEITLAGHSFGGATALATAIACKFQNIAAIIGIDPWLFPLRDELLEVAVPVPCLLLNTGTFSDRVPEYQIRARNIKLLRAHNNQSHMLMYQFFHTDHVSPCDVGFLMPRELSTLKMIRFPHLLTQGIILNREFIRLFVQKAVEGKRQIDEKLHDEIQEEFGDFCERAYGLRDFALDEMAVMDSVTPREIDLSID